MNISEIHVIESRPKLSKQYESVRNLLPDMPYKGVEFTLRNAHAEVANAIRRTALDEKCCIALCFEKQTLQTDSYAKIIPEQILERISQMALDQTLAPNHVTSTSALPKDLPQFQLEVTNGSAMSYKMITSKDIRYKSTDLRGKPLPFAGTYCLINLPPKCNIKIPTISVCAGYGYVDPAYMVTSVTYEKLPDKGQSAASKGKDAVETYTAVTGDYKIRVSGARIDPVRYVRECLDELISRVKASTDVMLKTVQQPHEGYFEFRVMGETHTIGALFNRYIYEADNTIEYCSYFIPRPTQREFVLTIKAADASQRIKVASAAIQRDLGRIASHFTEKRK